jgi:hypothetical protein
MGKMKTEFELVHETGPSSWRATIKKDGFIPVLEFWNDDLAPSYIQHKDLERFAVNILKALKSKRLKP